MRLLHRRLNILRIVVVATDDDQVLETTRDVQFTMMHEAQVARTQKWPFACISQVRPEGLLRLFWPPPVALSNAGTCYPDFAHLIGWIRGEGIRINDKHLLVC